MINQPTAQQWQNHWNHCRKLLLMGQHGIAAKYSKCKEEH